MSSQPWLSSRDVDTSKLGTLKGVFVPTLQNILGIILFVRVPFIVGHAGVGQALAIVWLASATTVLTSVSMSAVATNGVPRGGGCYSIVKSSLGAPFGGVTGILLFLSNTFGVAMYVLGAVEVLGRRSAFEDVDERVLGLSILAGLGLVVFVGISYIARFAIVFLSGVFLSIASIWLGVIFRGATDADRAAAGVSGFSAGNLRHNWGPGYQDGWDFGTCLAVFYPAVTDPLAGSNLSGDLRDPQAAIPKGTLAAVALTLVVFTLQVVVVAGASGERRPLRSDDGGAFVVALAWPFSEIVEVGILVSTLGAGLQSLAGAPRLLAAIGKDRLLPALAIFGTTGAGEPRLALLVCVVLSGCCVMLGKLDAVAPFITLWFLTCYAIINGTCALQAYDMSPSFRPTFKYYDWRASLLGVLLCACIMFSIQPLEACAALALAAALYKYIETLPSSSAEQLRCTPLGEEEDEKDPPPTPLLRGAAGGGSPLDSPASPPTDWRAGRRFKQVRNAILSLESGDLEFKYWRPFVLFLCKIDARDGAYVPQKGMINLVAQLMRKGRGLALVNGVLVDDLTERTAATADRATRRLQETLRDYGVEGFADIIVAPSLVAGQRMLLQTAGLGAFRPNALMLGWPDDNDPDAFYSILDDAKAIGKTTFICKACHDFPTEPVSDSGRIDIWWIYQLFPANGLLLLLPFLLRKSKVWKNSTLRLLVVSDDLGEDDPDINAALRLMLQAGGVKAECKILNVEIKDAPRYARRATMSSTSSKSTDAGPRKPPPPSNGGAAAASSGLPQVTSATWDSPSKLTTLVADYSKTADLVVIPLPDRIAGQSATDWINAVDTLIEPLARVILVRESGQEKVQFFQ
ncbi:hypothetical protein CTAYLR_003136 [Chrysophaeum taylorii]|uniref:Uncharacterized protein n=1 Tax=Chrysophaeum taylorii TaxID=2483200 RepID=A0AAD7UQ16_9STRA|nr:hypothetical protein CTAYLR_003136 [Chrysophaeum taylorii]